MSKIVIVSGFFNPLHGGHLDYLEGAKALGDKLIVIVNNDKQQIAKKGKIILDEDTRLRIIKALEIVDVGIVAIDDDATVSKTIQYIVDELSHPEEVAFIFANGGDRNSGKVVPEGDVCSKYNIKMIFDAGGSVKTDSSTRINKATGDEK